ncbi:MAG TPA: hypothetical protein VEY96_00930 [Actinomycetes bacterium]|nr:hypothetical protein [Actinomycetes bacterium]
MSRRLLVILVTLGVLAIGGGVAGGLLLARDPGGEPAVAGPTTIPETTAPVTSEPASSTSSTSASSSSTTSTTTGVSVQARVVQRLEDGVVVSYDASEPISAVLLWGFGGPSGHQLQFPGPAAQGTLKLALARTTRSVSMRVTGQSADGRTGTSGTLSARRLVRQVVLEVRSLTLDIPKGTGGIATGFRGTTFTPLGPGLAGPTAASEPYAFPSSVLGAGERSGPLALRFFHEVQPNPPRTRVVNLTVPFPRSGQSTLNRDVSAIGVTAHLRLRVTVTVS